MIEPSLNHTKQKLLAALKRVIKVSFILLSSFLLLIIAYITFELVQQHAWVKEQQMRAAELTPKQKEADFRYLTQVVHNYYPFSEANAEIKGLDNITQMDADYISKAKATKDNKEFIKLFNEYLQRIHQTGHAYIMKPEEVRGLNTFSFRFFLDIKKESFNQSEYWFNLLKSTQSSIYSDMNIFYKDGKYYLAEEFFVDGRKLPVGTEITKINALDTTDYVKSLQDKHWLRFDYKNIMVYISDPFSVNNNDGKKYWDVTFSPPNGDLLLGQVPKKIGNKIDARFHDNTFNQTFCEELNNETGYIRVFNFSGNYKSDFNKVQDFMQQSNNRYKKLIIDIRGNDGGDPEYWMKVFVQPLVKRTTYYERYAAIKKKLIDQWGLKLFLYQAGGGGIFNKKAYNFYNAEKIDYNHAEEKGLQTFKVTRVFKPENSFPFNGKVYLLVDNDCFSAAEDFAGAVKTMNLATIVGSNTQGGAAAYLAPFTFCLPESGIMFAIEPEITYNLDGKINEIYGTKPDIELEKSSYPTTYPLTNERVKLLEDPWIKRILEMK